MIGTVAKRAPAISPVIRAAEIERAILGVALWGTLSDWRGVMRAGFDPGHLLVADHRAAWQVIGPAMEVDMPALAAAVLGRWRSNWALFFDFLVDGRKLSRLDVATWMASAATLPRVGRVEPVPAECQAMLDYWIGEFHDTTSTQHL